MTFLTLVSKIETETSLQAVISTTSFSQLCIPAVCTIIQQYKKVAVTICNEEYSTYIGELLESEQKQVNQT